MLIRAMFLVVFVTTIAQATLYAAGATAKAALQRRATSAARAATVRGVALAQNAIAVSMKSNAPLALPSPATACAVQAGATCAFQATVALVAESPAPNDAQPCAAAACAVYLQSNDVVGEGRAMVRVHVAINSPGGDVIASRDTIVAFRTLRVPPYAIPAGANDATVDALTKTGTGDDGGAAGAGAGTLVNVVYSNGATTIPANVWGTRTEHPRESVPSWDR